MKPPVFIVGCPRSGTSYLYHLLLSAGGFAKFHTQMNVFDVLEPIYGDLGSRSNKQRMMKEWLQSKAFQVSGLNADEIGEKVMAECAGASDFLRIVMDEVARSQGVDRWVDSTPTNIPHMLRIKYDFPDSKFIHIIRDPRDLALSLDKKGWSRPLPWDRENSLQAAGIYWEWIVRKGRKYGEQIGSDYIEVRYEDLVQRPAEPLAKIGAFLGCDLSYERIRAQSVGSIKKPLTSFGEDLNQGNFSPVGRWKDKFPPQQLVLFEALTGPYMEQLGYQLSTCGRNSSLRVKTMRGVYGAFYSFKQWAKVNTPLSRKMVSYSDTLIDK
jgi:protein-tyrosine sulfotransferase